MSAGNLTRTEAAARAAVIGDVRYSIELDLTGAGDGFVSDTTIWFSSERPGESTFVDFFASELDVVELNGKPLDTSAFDGHRIPLPDLQRENELRARGRCAFQPHAAGMHRTTDPADGLVYMYTQFEPRDARRVFACFDQPDLKGTFDVAVRVPAGSLLVSNGPLVEQPASGAEGVWRCERTPQLSTYLVAFCIGPYHRVDGLHGELPLALYCRQSMAPYLDADDLFLITRQGLDHFHRLYGIPYPFAKYDQVFVPEVAGFGAMEHPGCVTFNDTTYLSRTKVTEAHREMRTGTLLHEMAHMWFGDLVTMRWWDDLWLNESFATYMGTRATAEATRFSEAWRRFTLDVKSIGLAADQRPSTHPISADIDDTDSLWLHFDGITYHKGASVLRQLGVWLGHDNFDAGVRAYLEQYQWSNATLAYFLAALAAASGRPVADWAKVWLEAAGVNTLSVALERDGDDLTGLTIEQTANDATPARPHRLAVGLYDLANGRLARRRLVDVDIDGPSTDVGLERQPVPALVVPNDGDLTFAKVHLGEHDVNALVEHLGTIDDALTRQICWSALWEMVRDARLPARTFTQIAIRHAPAEPDYQDASGILGLAHGAVSTYGDPAMRLLRRAALRRTVRDLLDGSEPGSDEHDRWVRTWLALTDEPDDLVFVRALLDGDATIAGFDLDVERRWRLVATLCNRGGAGDALIEAELARDRTDAGQRHALTCRATMPTAEAKAAAWERLVGDAQLPVATFETIVAGFYNHPVELCVPYVQRYPDAVDALFANHDHDTALYLCRELIPGFVVDRGTVAMFEHLLGRPDLDAGLRRAILDERADMERALRARAVDAAASR